LCFIAKTKIIKGESATLTWKAGNVVSVSLNRGIGIVRPAGSMRVSPAFTTRYTITAIGEFQELGMARHSVTLKVDAPEVDESEELEVPPDELEKKILGLKAKKKC